jgi:putative exosortase-associated protein (TIGR04073 family)
MLICVRSVNFFYFPLYNLMNRFKLASRTEDYMRKTLPFLAALVIVVVTSGCANVEQKFSRGVSNMAEFARLGEIQRSMEQTALFDGPGHNYTLGFVRGFDKSLVRTGVGIYEVVTCPIPPYDPVLTDYITPYPVYPDSYAPGMIAGVPFETDSHLGFSGGDVAPFIPGSRFKIFDTH